MSLDEFCGKTLEGIWGGLAGALGPRPLGAEVGFLHSTLGWWGGRTSIGLIEGQSLSGRGQGVGCDH